MNYYSKAFRTIHTSTDFFGETKENLFAMLDTLFLFIDSCFRDDDEFTVRIPLNIVMSSDEDNMYIFWGSLNAVSEMNIITTLRPYIGGSINDVNRVCKKELGFEIDYHLTLKKEDMSTFKGILLNVAETEDYTKRLHSLMEQYQVNSQFQRFLYATAQDIEKQTLKRRNILQFNPRFKARDLVVKDNQVFYVLPFTKGPLNAYQAIKDGIEKESIDCTLIKSEDRFDPTRGNNIIENIWQDICASRFIIADLSEKNPNVYYELGICDAIGKTVIPICNRQSLDEDYDNKLPFDISGNYTIFYNDDYSGMQRLKEDVNIRVNAILANSAVDIHR